MILIHDKTYRKRLKEIEYLKHEVEYLREDNERLESEKKDIIFQIEYYQRVNKELRRKLKEYEK